MAINLSDISGFSKFVGTKFVEDISFGEEPLIDVRVMTAEYAGLKAEKAKKAAKIEARKAAKKAKAPAPRKKPAIKQKYTKSAILAEIAENKLEELTRGSLAFSQGKIVARTYKHLYCIGE